MKTIPTYAHGILDYAIGIFLIIVPNIFGFAHLGGPAVGVARTVGVLMLVQALFTNYELGLFKWLPMQLHLADDYVLSVFLAVSPWLFGFNQLSGNVWLPHLIVGIIVFCITWMTQREPRRVLVRSTPAP